MIRMTWTALCPIAAMLSYLVWLGHRPVSLFTFETRRLLTRDRFVTALRSALEISGIDSMVYAEHSFWVGTATLAATRGLQDSHINFRSMGQHRIYGVYMHTPRAILISVAKSLVS